LGNKLIKTINKLYPPSAQYFGKVGDKPNTLRPMLQYVNDNISGSLVGVEVGVDRAFNARKILELMDIKTLYLVDPYAPYPVRPTVEQNEIRKNYAKEYLSGFEDKIEWVYCTSESASNLFERHVFDFVYLDGLHDYWSVFRDCVHWYPRVRKGGVLGGHDFVGSHKGLQRAVKEFGLSTGSTLFIEPDDWWIVSEG